MTDRGIERREQPLVSRGENYNPATGSKVAGRKVQFVWVVFDVLENIYVNYGVEPLAGVKGM
jgi:hypothetical protein